MSRRAEIVMSDAEFVAFITEQHTVTVASNGRDGWAHLMPLWYVVRDGELWVWTYASSQKVRNLARGSRSRFRTFWDLAYVHAQTSPSRTTYHSGIRCGQPRTPLVAQMTTRCWARKFASSPAFSLI